MSDQSERLEALAESLRLLREELGSRARSPAELFLVDHGELLVSVLQAQAQQKVVFDDSIVKEWKHLHAAQRGLSERRASRIYVLEAAIAEVHAHCSICQEGSLPCVHHGSLIKLLERSDG